MKPDIFIFDGPESLAEGLALDWQEFAKAASESGTTAFVAISGGATPRVAFKRLAKPPFRDRIPWGSVHLFWADERSVPPDHEESNFRMARETLLDHIPIPADRVHRIRGEDDPETEAPRYAEEIKRHVPMESETVPRFDWVQLGVGTDGHAASIFPGFHPGNRDICVVATHPRSGQKRITLTPETLNRAKRVSFIVTGGEKARVVAAILNQTPGSESYPASWIKSERGKTQWYLDKEAAAQLDIKTGF